MDEVANEFATLKLGDRRLEERARKSVTSLAAMPAVGVPSVLSEAELEGYYRLINNDRVAFAPLLRAHVDATVARTAGLERIVIAHDTTDFRFSDETPRTGLGPMDNGGQGFYAHFSLAIAEQRRPLGVVGVEPWTRKTRAPAKKTQKERYDNPTKEPLRWLRAVQGTSELFSPGVRVIHVMDREADDYDILCGLSQGDFGFVVRASYDRRLVSDCETDVRLKTFARELEVRCTREAKLSSRRRNRPAKQRKTHPPRDARPALLSFAAHTTTLRRPDKSKAPLSTLTLNVVHVSEPSPPDGCEPVEWLLYTTEPIDTEQEILQVVDDYRSRWLIEEYFKAIKTGCAFEKRQNESKDSLLNVLGIYIPIAWSLLNMRTLSRDPSSESRPAEDVFNAVQLTLVRLQSKGKLSERPTIREAVLLMARFFGGLLRSNGDPGWHVLARAYEKLLTMEVAWRLARAHLEISL
jgi:hypothetical protein